MYMRRQVFPHAPSPTMTSFLRMDSVIMGVCGSRWDGVDLDKGLHRVNSRSKKGMGLGSRERANIVKNKRARKRREGYLVRR